MAWLKRYVRIENLDHDESPLRSAFCFVEIKTGEVLKPRSWKAPDRDLTKVKRDNIFDEHNGLKHMGPYGVTKRRRREDGDTPSQHSPAVDSGPRSQSPTEFYRGYGITQQPDGAFTV
jgi:hypothetical protein